MNERYCGEHKILIVTVSRRNIEPPGELIGPTLISLHILVNSEELSNQLQKKHHNSNKVFYLVLGGWLSMYLTLSGGVQQPLEFILAAVRDKQLPVIFSELIHIEEADISFAARASDSCNTIIPQEVLSSMPVAGLQFPAALHDTPMSGELFAGNGRDGSEGCCISAVTASLLRNSSAA